jgi:hypothetical protein
MIITLKLPATLSMGSRPYSQVTAAYHWVLSGRELTVEEYALEWGWSQVEARIFLLQLQLLEVAEDWHDSCFISNYNINITTKPISNTVSGVSVVGGNINLESSKNKNTNTNSSRTVILEKLGLEIPVEDNCKNGLYNSFVQNSDCIDLLSYWVCHYQIYFEEAPTTICAADMGTISKCVRTGKADKAVKVLDWAFTADHYRANFLRERGILFPANLISSQKLEENYRMASVKPLPAASAAKDNAATAVNINHIPSFDENGNLITK